MVVLKNRIDFALIISVIRCNPNGDPMTGNRPRIDYEGYGMISDVCLKRKIRNRLFELGEDIICKTDEQCGFENHSMRKIVEAEKDLMILLKAEKEKEFVKLACEKWIDVRSFGQTFAFKGANNGGGVSLGIRGPVSIQFAKSIDTVDILDLSITKCINYEDSGKKGRDTIGKKYCVDKGVYVTYGSIYPQLAELTGFTEDDAEKIKLALSRLFENDASAARPAGSLNVEKVFWWEHNSKSGACSVSKVHNSLKVTPVKEPPYYIYEVEDIKNVNLEII